MRLAGQYSGWRPMVRRSDRLSYLTPTGTDPSSPPWLSLAALGETDVVTRFRPMLPARDHLLPPDIDAYRHALHPRGRVIVIAPTRAACETIELALHTHVDTLLEREHGSTVRQWSRDGKGFGIVAGTGTGKTLGIRLIAEEILVAPLLVGVVNREREATPETPQWNVVVVTTG